MNAVSISAVVLAVVALAAPASVPAGTTSNVQRCEGSQGEVVYTDRSCATLGARTMPMSSELVSRIARGEAASTEVIDFSEVPAAGRVGGRSPTYGCAHSKRQLARDIQESLALHDVNRLAESYHWVGKSNREARQHMIRLERMATQRLDDDVRLTHVRVSNVATQLEHEGIASPGGGIVQVTLGTGTTQQVVDLELLRYSGCYFARL